MLRRVFGSSRVAARAARDAAAGGAAPKYRCGNSAWEHEIVLIYKRRGLHGVVRRALLLQR